MEHRLGVDPPLVAAFEMDSMKSSGERWLQLYVDAMTERDPYKRLALVRELRRLRREREGEGLQGVVMKHEPRRLRSSGARKTKTHRSPLSPSRS